MPVLENKCLTDPELVAEIDSVCSGEEKELSLDHWFSKGRPVRYRSNSDHKPPGPFLQFSLVLRTGKDRYGFIERKMWDIETGSRRTGSISLLASNNPCYDLVEILLNSFSSEAVEYLKSKAKLDFRFLGLGASRKNASLSYAFAIWECSFDVSDETLKTIEEILTSGCLKDDFIGFGRLQDPPQSSHEGKLRVHSTEESFAAAIVKRQKGLCDAALVEFLQTAPASVETTCSEKPQVEGKPVKVGSLRRIPSSKVLYYGAPIDQKKCWKASPGSIVDFNYLKNLSSSRKFDFSTGSNFDEELSTVIGEATRSLEDQNFTAAAIFLGIAVERLLGVVAECVVDASSLLLSPSQRIDRLQGIQQVSFKKSVDEILSWLTDPSIGAHLCPGWLVNTDNLKDVVFLRIKQSLKSIWEMRNDAVHPRTGRGAISPSTLFENLEYLKTGALYFFGEVIYRSEYALLRATATSRDAPFEALLRLEFVEPKKSAPLRLSRSDDPSLAGIRSATRSLGDWRTNHPPPCWNGDSVLWNRELRKRRKWKEWINSTGEKLPPDATDPIEMCSEKTVVDEWRRLEAARRLLGLQSIPRYTVQIVCVTRIAGEERFLMQSKEGRKPQLFGGKMEVGETLEIALRRELAEPDEILSVGICQEDLRDLVLWDQTAETTESRSDGLITHYRFALWLCWLASDHPATQNEELWFSKENILNHISPALRNCFEQKANRGRLNDMLKKLR